MSAIRPQAEAPFLLADIVRDFVLTTEPSVRPPGAARELLRRGPTGIRSRDGAAAGTGAAEARSVPEGRRSGSEPGR